MTFKYAYSENMTVRRNISFVASSKPGSVNAEKDAILLRILPILYVYPLYTHFSFCLLKSFHLSTFKFSSRNAHSLFHFQSIALHSDLHIVNGLTFISYSLHFSPSGILLSYRFPLACHPSMLCTKLHYLVF